MKFVEVSKNPSYISSYHKKVRSHKGHRVEGHTCFVCTVKEKRALRRICPTAQMSLVQKYLNRVKYVEWCNHVFHIFKEWFLKNWIFKFPENYFLRVFFEFSDFQ